MYRTQGQDSLFLRLLLSVPFSPITRIIFFVPLSVPNQNLAKHEQRVSIVFSTEDKFERTDGIFDLDVRASVKFNILAAI